MRNWQRIIVGVLLAVSTLTYADTTSYPRNQLWMRGATPNLLLTDLGGTGDITLQVNQNVLRMFSSTSGLHVNAINDGTLGIEMSTPTGLMQTPTTGGSLANGSYYFKVVACDASPCNASAGTTIPSSEVTCTLAGANDRCALSWTATLGALEYRIYKGTSSNGEDKYKTTVSTSFNWDSDSGATAGVVPEITSAQIIRFSSSGIRFPDGTTQTTASGSSFWSSSGANIFNTNAGNVGIGSGASFSAAAKLNIFNSGSTVAIFLDDYGTGFESNYVSRHARGTFAVPTAAGISDVLGSFSVRPYDGTSFVSTDAGAIVFRGSSTLAFSGVNRATSLEFYTTDNASTTLVLRAKLHPSGSFNIGPSTADPGILMNIEGAINSTSTITAAIELKTSGRTNLKIISTPTTITAGDQTFILCDAGGGSFTVDLPSNAAGVLGGRVYIIKNRGLINNCTVDPFGTQTSDLSIVPVALGPGSTLRLVADPDMANWSRW